MISRQIGNWRIVLAREPKEGDRGLDELMNRIGDRLESVRPLHPPWIRAGWLGLTWPFLLALTLTAFGLRRDYGQIGEWASWGVSALEWAAAYWVAWIGLRLAVPSELAAMSVRAALFVGGIGLQLAGAAWAFHTSPSWVEPGQELRLLMVCFLFISLLAALPLLLALRLAAEGLLAKPAQTGLLLGLSAGLAAEASWRMHCPYTSWEHILAGHFSALIATILIGLFSFWRRRSSSRSARDEGAVPR
jgi:hypothetical protein